jgi:hypothetical protein
MTLVPLLLADTLRTRVVFDAQHPGAALWGFPLYFFGAAVWLAFISTTIRYFHRQDSPQVAEAKPKQGIVLDAQPMVLLLVGAIAAALMYVVRRPPYAELAAALDSGGYETVVGIAQGVTQGDPGGFTVLTSAGTRKYEYSEHFSTEGFHERNVPFGDGAHVRVLDVGGRIARLEVQQ